MKKKIFYLVGCGSKVTEFYANKENFKEFLENIWKINHFPKLRMLFNKGTAPKCYSQRDRREMIEWERMGKYNKLNILK